MRYNHFKNADADISALTVGTWGIAGANSAGVTWGNVDTEESIAAIRQMIDNGVNMVDTAPIYGDGHSETVVGQALKDGYREKVYLATKFGSYISHYTGKSVRDNKYNSVEREIDESLARLQTDYIDFYIMHWPDENTPIEETMAVCNMLKKKGKIRYIGMSNSSKELIQEAQKYAKIDVIQPPFSIVNQSERELMEWAETQGIGTMTYGSLGGGILTGAIRELPKPDPKDMRQVFYPFFKEPVFSNVMELLKTLDKIAEAHNVPVAQVSINWSTQKSFVGTALTGVNTPAQADENCSAFEVAKDRIVEQPRIISGAIIDDYMKMAALSELNMHFVNSHFIHPDDLLDEDRGAALGWEKMKSNLAEYMDWLVDSAPSLRQLTGSELSGAIQRYGAVTFTKTVTEQSIELKLKNFYDEAYFMVRINEGTPGEVSGGKLTHLTGNLYLLQAKEPTVTIEKLED